MERVVGREADAGENLLAVCGHRARGAAGGRLGQRRGHRAGFVPRGRQRRVECLDRNEGFRQAVPHGLELGDRSPELHALDRVRPRLIEHGPGATRDLVGDRAPPRGERRLPRGGVDGRDVGRRLLDAHQVQTGAGIDAAHGRDVRILRRRD